MRISIKRVLAILGIAIVLSAIPCGIYLWKAALVASGYKAKCLCSAVFVSRRAPAKVMAEDLLPVGPLYPIKFVDTKIDFTAHTVTASINGFAERKAVFRDGLGCTLVIGDLENPAGFEGVPLPARDSHRNENGIWPDGEIVDTGHPPPPVDGKKLDQVMEWAFQEPDSEHPRRTRALIVVHDGRIVAERYAPGITAKTPMPGWSMTKSVFGALAGILIDKGKISLESKDLLPMWRTGQDPRRAITFDDLLHMSSGLAFQEDYTSPLSDVAVMLFGTRDMAYFAADKPLVSDPGVKWHYSSGGTNIISRVMRNTFGKAEKDYLQFPRKALFDRIGMESAVVEPDASGTLTGSSCMFATARDWARFGLLLLHDGMWGKDRVLPEGWTKYCTSPGHALIDKEKYGAHFWLCVPSDFRSGEEPGVNLPGDAYHAVGYDGQFISIIPSRKLVVVRLGLTRTLGWDQEELIRRIIDATGEQAE